MSDTSASPFDESRAHRHFSAQCFNRTWELIDKPDRSPANDEQMLLRAYASLWHWTQRPDCTSRNLSIGYWLLSRVHGLLRQSEQARHFGKLSLKHAEGESPFYRGYAYEALARAAHVAHDRSRTEYYLQAAQAQADLIENDEERQMLENDLKSLA